MVEIPNLSMGPMRLRMPCPEALKPYEPNLWFEWHQVEGKVYVARPRSGHIADAQQIGVAKLPQQAREVVANYCAGYVDAVKYLDQAKDQTTVNIPLVGSASQVAVSPSASVKDEP
jgi:hypothetical protein